MAKVDPRLMFRFRSNNQTKEFVNESVRSMSEEFARVIVNQVVIAASDAAFQSARSILVNNVRAAVSKEVVQLAYMVGKFLVQPHNATGPSGRITPFEKDASEQAVKNRWALSGFELNKGGVHWQKRTHDYLMWKAKKVKHENWWDLTGDLKRDISKTGFYYENFGPVSVQFVRNNQITPGKDITSTGRGRTSATAHVGSIIVNVLGRITPDMLPALATGDPQGGAMPTGRSNITQLLAEGSTKDKLVGRKAYRPVLEPFLAYYLTRAIPNAIYKQTEKLVDVSAGANFLKPKAGPSLAAFSGGGAG